MHFVILCLYINLGKNGYFFKKIIRAFFFFKMRSKFDEELNFRNLILERYFYPTP